MRDHFHSKVGTYLTKATRRHIKAVRSDRDGKYTSTAFMEYCKEQGIGRFLTALYTPQLIGVAERKNWTILDMVRSMLKSKRMTRNFGQKSCNAPSTYKIDVHM